VDGLIHTHAWAVEATVEGDAGAAMVYPVDDLEALILAAVTPWTGHYLTNEDLGEWKGFKPLVWDVEPTVEEVARRIWAELHPKIPGLHEVALVESTEFDRCRTVRLSR
jgi:6-pyruvoyl-tetrahydropterin synthase